jgi:CBS domain containing-hemolysin-like protein
VFSISIDAVMNEKTYQEIKAKGYSRIPVYYGECKGFIIGILIIKTLIGADMHKATTLRDLCKQ